MTVKYAKDGFKFYQVITTNSGNMEVELPEKPDDFLPEDDEKMMQLQGLAETHGVSITSSTYRRL